MTSYTLNKLKAEIEHLKTQRNELLEALEQLVMINKIYSEDKEYDFAWAEMQNAKQVIAKAKG